MSVTPNHALQLIQCYRKSEMLAGHGKEPNQIQLDLVKSKSGRGGKRSGAGRKPTGMPPATVVKRIPAHLADKIEKFESLLQLIDDWDERAATAKESNPRWEWARKMLAEMNELLQD